MGGARFAIKGIITPIITPLHEDESLNEDELRRQVNRQIEGGASGIFCCGTNGESYVLSEAEKLQIFKVVVDEVGGRVPVYAGTGCVSTRDTIRLSLLAQETGVDALSIITPYFAALSQDDLCRHYEAVARAVNLPVILYNMPARTGINIAPATLARLAQIDGIAGIKDSSGNFDNMLQYIEQTRQQKLAVLSGNDALILWNLLAGGAGAVAGCANVYPRTISGIYEAFQAGDLARARALQDSIRSLRNCFRFGNPNTVVKTAVAMLGYPVGKCRAPFEHVSEEGLSALRQVLEENKAKGLS